MSKTVKKPAASKAGKAGRFSWLRLAAPAKPEPAVRELQQQSQDRLGYVRNFLKLPFGPGRLALYQGYLDKLMRGADGELPRPFTMDDDELRTLLEELHREIEATDHVDEKGRELLSHLSVDIHNLLERTGHEQQLRATSGRSAVLRNPFAISRSAIPA